MQKKYYQEHKERIKERVRKWRKEHPDHRYFHNAKQRAKKNGLEFTITWEFYINLLSMTKICPILGLTLGKNFGGGKPAPWSRSLDRIDNAKGYTPENVQIISYRANELKRDATLDEILQFAQWVNGFKKGKIVKKKKKKGKNP